MADNQVLDFSDVTGFEAAFAQSPQWFIPFATDAMDASVRILQGGMAEYPPATEANQPGRFNRITHEPMGYYERGRGWWYPIMTRETLQNAAAGKFGKSRGVIRASNLMKSFSRVKGYKLAGGGESEQLGKSWAVDVKATADSVTGEVGTNTSYAEFVQGDEQSGILARYGWDEHRMDVVVENLMPDLDAVWNLAAEQFVQALTGA
jgi:hypothetical protein